MVIPLAVVVAPETTEAVAGDHVKLNGPTPVATAVAVPAPPLHNMEDDVTVTDGPVGLVSEVTKVRVQRPSEMITEYAPAARLVAQVAFPPTGNQV